MERETVEITTPVKNIKVVLKAWLTGRERRDIRSILLDSVKFSTISPDDTDESLGQKATYDFDGHLMDKMNDKAIETVVVSVDGETKNVLEKILDMRERDYEFVVQEINRVTSDLSEDEKKS